jgi:hypothetical protein
MRLHDVNAQKLLKEFENMAFKDGSRSGRSYRVVFVPPKLNQVDAQTLNEVKEPYFFKKSCL